MARRSTKISTEGKPWARYLRLSKAEAEEVKGLTKEQRLELTNRKLDGDKLALDTVLAEVMTDPTGTPGLLFVLLD